MTPIANSNAISLSSMGLNAWLDPIAGRNRWRAAQDDRPAAYGRSNRPSGVARSDPSNDLIGFPFLKEERSHFWVFCFQAAEKLHLKQSFDEVKVWRCLEGALPRLETEMGLWIEDLVP
ncbi:MAG: hypothetical protein WCF81_22200 [Roseiarcus sp.]